jgi:hypothetical protein
MPPRRRWPASSAPSRATPRTRSHAAGHPQPPPRRPWRGHRLRGLCVATRCRSTMPPARTRRWPRRACGLGPGAGARRKARLPQRPGHGDRPDRHHRPGHGLRHHRHRARLRPGEVQEARRRRLLQDHQPRRSRSPARLGYGSRDRRDRSLCGRPRHLEQAPGTSTRRRSRPRASPTRAWRRSSRARRRPSTSSSSSTAGRSATSRWPNWVPEEKLIDPAFDLLTHSGLHQGRDRGGQHLCLRRDDPGRRAAPQARALPSSTAPTRAAASASASCRWKATSA